MELPTADKRIETGTNVAAGRDLIKSIIKLNNEHKAYIPCMY